MNRAMIVSALSILSCVSPATPERVELCIEVADSAGSVLVDVSVSVNGKQIGKTDAAGGVRTFVVGREGARLSVLAQCPQGTVAGREAETQITFRALRAMDGARSALLPLHARLVCTSVTQKFVLIVKTNQAKRIPISAQGRVVGTTDEDGVAQIVLSGNIGEEVEVVLNTQSHPDLSPKSPNRRLVIPETPQILLFEQDFKIDEKPRKKAKRGPAGPRRI